MGLTALFVTFNCGKLRHDAADLTNVIDEALCGFNQAPQFLVLAAQEVAPIREASFGSVASYTAPLARGVDQALKRKFSHSRFSQICVESNGAIALIVFASVPTLTTSLQRVSVGFGWSSLKGALSLGLKIAGHPIITVVAAHLAANEGFTAERNETWGTIAQELDLQDSDGPVVVLGDLNYRCDDAGEDELRREMSAGRTMWGLSEAEIKFKPTFKYYEGTKDYNYKRIPSWCDRILWSQGRPMVYGSLNYHASDHQPVYLWLELDEATARSHVSLQGPRHYPRAHPLLSSATDYCVGVSLFLGTTTPGRVISAVAVVAILYYLF